MERINSSCWLNLNVCITCPFLLATMMSCFVTGPIDRKWQFPFRYGRTLWTRSWRRWDTPPKSRLWLTAGMITFPHKYERTFRFFFIYLSPFGLFFFPLWDNFFVVLLTHKRINWWASPFLTVLRSPLPTVDFNLLSIWISLAEIKWASHGDRNNCKTCWLVSILQHRISAVAIYTIC
jgi:hypothetical protein